MPYHHHCHHSSCYDVCYCSPTTCVDYDIERTFRVERYLSKLEAQREREHERLRVAKELELREAHRLQKYQELLAAETEARAKRQAEREAELLRASKIRAEIRDLKHQRHLVEAETHHLTVKTCRLSCGCYETCCCIPSYTTYCVPAVHHVHRICHSSCCSSSCYCCL